jgi:aryl-alcohol dehydrogenase-like predicted oxidoreductase
MAKFAFGTQRISEFNPLHIQALKEAIKSGVDLIDTSSDYMNSSSHRAIAIAFRELEKDEIKNIKIVSKFTYKEDGDISKKLKITLNELNQENIECFMLHNLELYLLDAISKEINKDDRLDGMNKIVYKVFFELENEIKNGQINSYGISSENFSLNHSLDEFLPYEDLISIANIASQDAGNKQNSFKYIEFPLNLLEKDGLKCALWAKENSLTTLSSRPLNAIYNQKIYRLAEYDESDEYYTYLNEVLDLCDNDILKPLYNLFEELDSSKHKFTSVYDYDSFLYTQAIILIKEKIELLDNENQNTLLNYIELFLNEYREMVAYECSLKTKKVLNKYFEDCTLPMQKCSLKFLQKQNNIDYILVGMRKPSYVAEVLTLS